MRAVWWGAPGPVSCVCEAVSEASRDAEHPEDGRGTDQGGRGSGSSACHLFALSGKCKYEEKCKFSHDQAVCDAWKTSNPSVTLREVLEEEGVDEDMNEVIPPELAEFAAGEEVQEVFR